jgi:ribosomal protein S12 methylthiotransferase accessory factor
VYFRDVSFLGFPAVYIYVTTISLLGKKESHLNLDSQNLEMAIDLDSIEDLFFPLKSITNEKLLKLADIFELVLETKPELYEIRNLLKLEFTTASDWNHIPVSFFLVLFWYRLGNLEQADQNLKRFMAETDNKETEYYQIILQFLTALKQGAPLESISQKLISAGASSQLVNEVVEFLTDKNRLFDQINLPQCPDCQACSLNQECLTRNKLNFAFRYHQKMKENPLRQEWIGEVV